MHFVTSEDNTSPFVANSFKTKESNLCSEWTVAHSTCVCSCSQENLVGEGDNVYLLTLSVSVRHKISFKLCIVFANRHLSWTFLGNKQNATENAEAIGEWVRCLSLDVVVCGVRASWVRTLIESNWWPADDLKLDTYRYLVCRLALLG